MNKLLIPARAWVRSPTATFIDICVCSLAQCPGTEGPVCARGWWWPWLTWTGSGRQASSPQIGTGASAFLPALLGIPGGEQRRIQTPGQGETRKQMPASQGTRRQGGPRGCLICLLVRLFVYVFAGLPESLGPQARASWAHGPTGCGL